MEGLGTVIGKRAPNFTLEDQSGEKISLYKILNNGPVMLVFYPGDFTLVCTKQLCNYRDAWPDFEKFGIQLYGISTNSTEEHLKFATKYEFPFKLLSDFDRTVALQYEVSSFIMFGRSSRAILILNSRGIILYRYVEPTVLTRRKADELLLILQDLRDNGLV